MGKLKLEGERKKDTVGSEAVQEKSRVEKSRSLAELGGESNWGLVGGVRRQKVKEKGLDVLCKTDMGGGLGTG